MSTIGHERELISVGGLKAALQKLKTDKIDPKSNISETVSAISYNTAGKKITKTTNGSVTDVVSASTIVIDGGGITSHQDISGKADKSTTLAGYGITDAYTKDQTYTRTEINNLVTTPDQKYVTVANMSELPNPGAKDTIYRVGGNTFYTEYGWNGSAYIKLSEKHYDVDTTPVVNSEKLITSGGVFDKITTKSFVIPANTTSWIDKTSLLKGKKVLMKSNVNGLFPIYDESTSLAMGLYNHWVFYDFTNIQSTVLFYPSGNTSDVTVLYTDDESVIYNYLRNNILDVAYKGTEAQIGGFYLSTAKDAVGFKSFDGTLVGVFPERSSNLHCIFNIDTNTILKIGNELYRWNSDINKFVSFVDESSIIDEKKISVISNSDVELTINVNIPIGAYQIKGQFSGDCYVTINCKDADGNVLAGDKYGNDDNERSTIPNTLYNKTSLLSKRVYFGSLCTSVEIKNPNGAIISLEFDPIEGSKEYDVVVAADGSGQLNSLYDALRWIGDTPQIHKTIFVKPGVYEMPSQNFNTNAYRNKRNISIIGASKNNCIIRNDDGYYDPGERDTCPLQLSGKVTVKNLTIISTDDNLSQGTMASAYCIHIDYAANVGDVYLIENCNLYNDHGCCIGIGLRPGLTIKVKNCELQSVIGPDYPLWHGAIAAHDSGDSNEPQKLEIINNIIKSSRKGFSFTGNNHPLDILFIGNAIFKGANDQLVTLEGDAGAFIDDETCLNNVSFDA